MQTEFRKRDIKMWEIASQILLFAPGNDNMKPVDRHCLKLNFIHKAMKCKTLSTRHRSASVMIVLRRSDERMKSNRKIIDSFVM